MRQTDDKCSGAGEVQPVDMSGDLGQGLVLAGQDKVTAKTLNVRWLEGRVQTVTAHMPMECSVLLIR